VEQDEKEQEYAGSSLKKIEPVPSKAIIRYVWLGFGRDQDAVNRVKQKGQKYTKYLNKKKIRHIVDVLHMLVKHGRSIHSGRIRVHVDKEKHPQRHNACQLVQLSQKKGIREFDRHRNGTNYESVIS